jgi:hypothetical protein
MNKVDSIFNALNNHFLFTSQKHWEEHVDYYLEDFTDKYDIDFEYTFITKASDTYILSEKEEKVIKRWLSKLYSNKKKPKSAAELLIRAGIFHLNWK